MSMKSIVICCSGSFYEHANQLADQLEKLGYKAVVPATARQMKTSGDYDIDKIKTWYHDSKDASIKAGKMYGHFEEIAKGDAVLMLNDDKPVKPRYIGPNGFMEWGLAAYLKKPVYIFNAIPKDVNYWEESLMAFVLDGDLGKIDI